jgi:hypothetical protein
MLTSTCCPSPVRNRCSSAARIPAKANVPAIVSARDEPAFIGGPSGSPVMLISPAAACTIVS